MPSPRLRALLAVVLVALAACSGGGDDGSSSTTTSDRAGGSSRLRWRECADGECASLRVPLDPATPRGEQISLALARVPAGDPERRIGSLLVNPGGPGSPGTDFVSTFAELLPESITDRFDIVSWDPRGTGQSAPVRCGTRLDYLFDVDVAPDDVPERQALEAVSQRFARECAERSGPLLAHISSTDTVHDVDQIREAVGDPKLTYMGLSYGTYIGALYAQAYPEKVRALVLDGAIDPAIPIEEISLQQAKGFEASLQAFLDDCARRDGCEFHGGGDPSAALRRLRDRVDRTPLRGDDGRELGPTELDIALAAPLYAGEAGYALLASALAAGEEGDPGELLEQFDEYVLRDPDGRYASEWPAFIAISCVDGPELDVPTFATLQARAAAAAPYFGASNLGLGLACAYWPVPPVNPQPTAVTAPGAPPIVVVGTTGDPATPLTWSESLARALGSGRLVTVDGTAHTSSLDGNPCLDRALTRYLVDDRAPRAGLRCEG